MSDSLSQQDDNVPRFSPKSHRHDSKPEVRSLHIHMLPTPIRFTAGARFVTAKLNLVYSGLGRHSRKPLPVAYSSWRSRRLYFDPTMVYVIFSLAVRGCVSVGVGLLSLP